MLVLLELELFDELELLDSLELELEDDLLELVLELELELEDAELDDTVLEDEDDLVGADDPPEHCDMPAKARMTTAAATAMAMMAVLDGPPPDGAGGVGGVGGSGAGPSSETVPTTTPQLWQNLAPSGSSAPQLLQYMTPPFA